MTLSSPAGPTMLIVPLQSERGCSGIVGRMSASLITAFHFTTLAPDYPTLGAWNRENLFGELGELVVVHTSWPAIWSTSFVTLLSNAASTYAGPRGYM